MAAIVIKRQDLEHQIALVQATALLQLAHPWIAAAIADHSSTMMDPVGRFHRTFSIMFSIVFGTLDQALAAARNLHERHAQISGLVRESIGPFPKGSSYLANELDALRWVSATLTETSLIAYDLVLPPLSGQDRECYYSESKTVAALFGIPPALLPDDWKTFMLYNERMWKSEVLTVTPAARAIADRILWQRGRWLSIPKWYRTLTTLLLPSPVRDGFKLPYGSAEQKSAENSLRWIRRLYSVLPEHIRFVGPYHEAVGRLLGRPRPSLTTQALNQFWIGQSALI